MTSSVLILDFFTESAATAKAGLEAGAIEAANWVPFGDHH
jgi:hypothetical protein